LRCQGHFFNVHEAVVHYKFHSSMLPTVESPAFSLKCGDAKGTNVSRDFRIAAKDDLETIRAMFVSLRRSSVNI
jgi:hypothetical protein